MKSPGEEYPEKVKENNNQKNICAPMMDVADELTKENVVLQVKDGLVGPVGNRLIDEFQHHARGEQ